MLTMSALLALTMTAGAPAPRAVSDSTPQKACITPDRTGSFRVTATQTDGKYGSIALVLLENVSGCLEASSSPTIVVRRRSMG